MSKDYLYLIVDTQSCAVKIGRSQNPRERLEQLQKSNPRELVLLHVFPFLGEVEPFLHQYKELEKYRIRGEWYDFTPELLHIVFDYIYHDFFESVINAFEAMEIAPTEDAEKALGWVWYELFAHKQVEVGDEAEAEAEADNKE